MGKKERAEKKKGILRKRVLSFSMDICKKLSTRAIDMRFASDREIKQEAEWQKIEISQRDLHS